MRVPTSTDPQSASTVRSKSSVQGAALPGSGDRAAAWRAQSTTNSFAPTLVLERCGATPSAT